MESAAQINRSSYIKPVVKKGLAVVAAAGLVALGTMFMLHYIGLDPAQVTAGGVIVGGEVGIPIAILCIGNSLLHARSEEVKGAEEEVKGAEEEVKRVEEERKNAVAILERAVATLEQSLIQEHLKTFDEKVFGGKEIFGS